jgi:hypothetical protein
MSKRKRNKKFYLVLSGRNNYMHGVFPHSPEGLKLAESFIKNKKDSEKEKLYILEK